MSARPRRAHRHLAAACVVLAAVAATCRPALAQQRPGDAGPDSAAAAPPAAVVTVQQPGARTGVSPAGAMLRAMLVPGWGHASIGSYTRGGFYFAVETLTAYAFIRTRIRLDDARERVGYRENFLREELARAGVSDPAQIQERLDGDELLQSYRELVDSRESQQEDLLAFGIFLIFLTGADAYVSAHLAGFPAPIDLEASVGDDGRTELAVRIALPR
ncbi:MAG TPA: DUF5683 domain-containing protein [Longimicrobiales bacterium]|nr:DUF5683 domain-containing protein [Longimicrobiales bacterium]